MLFIFCIFVQQNGLAHRDIWCCACGARREPALWYPDGTSPVLDLVSLEGCVMPRSCIPCALASQICGYSFPWPPHLRHLGRALERCAALRVCACPLCCVPAPVCACSSCSCLQSGDPSERVNRYTNAPYDVAIVYVCMDHCGLVAALWFAIGHT